MGNTKVYEQVWAKNVKIVLSLFYLIASKKILEQILKNGS